MDSDVSKQIRGSGFDDPEGERLEFLLTEGLEALAAFKAIKNPAVRAMFIRLMREAAKAYHHQDKDLH